mgnify:CR=1 FL=1
MKTTLVKKRQLSIFVIDLFFFFVSGCGLHPPIQTLGPMFTATGIPELSSPKPLLTVTSGITNTIISPTTIIATIPKATTSPKTVDKQSEESIPTCLNSDRPLLFTDLPEIQGTLFYTYGNGDDLYTLNGSPPQIQRVLPIIPNLDALEFSPDGQWLVGFEQDPEPLSMNKYSFQLVSKSGKVFPKSLDISDVTDLIHRKGATTYFLQHWYFEWINPRILKVYLGYGENRPSEYVSKYYDIQDEAWWEALLQNLPDWDNDFGWSQVSPDLTHVLYLDRNGQIVLYDLENKNELWTRDAGGFNPFISSAQWNTDSQRVAFRTSTEQTIIQITSRNGDNYSKAKEISFTSESKDLFMVPDNFIWSPEGRYLAISGRISDTQGLQRPSLYLYDTENDAYVFRCAMGDPVDHVNALSILFSPDGSHIASSFEKYNNMPFYLYDLTRQSVYQIEEGNAGAIGWVEDFSRDWK